jgi:hypothetical protein
MRNERSVAGSRGESFRTHSSYWHLRIERVSELWAARLGRDWGGVLFIRVSLVLALPWQVPLVLPADVQRDEKPVCGRKIESLMTRLCSDRARRAYEEHWSRQPRGT